MDDILELILYVVGFAAILLFRALGQKKKRTTPGTGSAQEDPFANLESLLGLEKEEEPAGQEEPVAEPVYRPESLNTRWEEGEDAETEVFEEPVPIEVQTPVMKAENAFLHAELSELHEEGESILSAPPFDSGFIADEISAGEIGGEREGLTREPDKFFRSELRKAVLYSEILKRKY